MILIMTRRMIMTGGLAAIVSVFFMAGPAEAGFRSYLKAKYDSLIRSAALRNGLDPALVHAVVLTESAYNRWAVSGAGAQGLMQLMPGTAAHYGVEDPFDPESNIEGGAKYLKELSRLYGGRTELVLAAYNAGQAAVKKYDGIPPYAETRAYVESVKASFAKSLNGVRTRVFTIVDASGKTIITNDLRLAQLRAR
jgi:soluble lytic murein transglycosylase-like protein